jgi:hypothetical protein
MDAPALERARSLYRRPTSVHGDASIPFARVVRSALLVAPRVSAPLVMEARVPSRAVRALVSGIVAGSAVLGVLIGIGHRTGTTWRPVNAAAYGVLGTQADGVWSYHGSVTPVGGLVVLVLSVVAGFVVARIAPTFRTLHVLATSAAVALAGYLLHLHVVARTPGGLADLLTVGELRGLYLTLGIALAAGMRLAFSPVAAASER